jgi:hypothetical protein
MKTQREFDFALQNTAFYIAVNIACGGPTGIRRATITVRNQSGS